MRQNSSVGNAHKCEELDFFVEKRMHSIPVTHLGCTKSDVNRNRVTVGPERAHACQLQPTVNTPSEWSEWKEMLSWVHLTFHDS